MNRNRFCLSALLFLLMSSLCLAQSPDAAPSQDQNQAPPPANGQGVEQGGPMMRDHGAIGRLTSITGDTMILTRRDGTTTTVKLSDKTEFRKDREPAKLSDFKVGDLVMVRGEENSDNSVTAEIVATRTGGAGQGGMRGGQFSAEMGKDVVVGEVKSVEAPKLTVVRTDNVTQTVELNEDTTLRKNRQSITMADIQPGDHVIVRGALQNDIFVPKAVIILTPEQWGRIQQFMEGTRGRPDTAPPANSTNNPPKQ
ncbi:MAG TPA: DUF5666 domain-containing protein [Candidatus Eisenbacteria bacterium]|nr:DUF5666 domain-containing protein [Candidatus Eisenbacteria bacterium]